MNTPITRIRVRRVCDVKYALKHDLEQDRCTMLETEIHLCNVYIGHLWGCQEKTKCCSTWEDAAAARVSRGHSNPWHKPVQNTRLDQVN